MCTREGRQLNFLYIIPFPKLALGNTKRELPSWKEFLSPEKEDWVEQHLPLPLGALHKVSTSASPHPDG